MIESAPGALRRPASRETRHGEIEAAPEEVHGAALAQEVAAEALEQRCRGQQDAPEGVRGGRVVGRVDRVFLETDRVRDLDRHRPDLHRKAGTLEHRHDGLVEVGDRPGLERQRLGHAVGALEHERVVDEVEREAERPPAQTQGGSREPARAHAESDVPEVIGRRGEGETHLAHDLRPQVQGRAGGLPGLERQRRPGSRVGR